MPSYDIAKLMEKMNALENQGGGKKRSGGNDKVKLTWWKPQIGDPVEIRFLPYEYGDEGNPFQEIAYYNSKRLSERRLVAPFQFGRPDPVQELYNQLEPKRADDNVFALMKELRTRESYYAPILVRGEEDKGVQIWEMSQKVVQTVYSKLAHPDFVDIDLLDPNNGHDFIVTATDSGKTFNGYPVKNVNIEPRFKAKKLAAKKAEQDAILKSIPNLKEYFEGFVMNEEKLADLVENFLSFDDEPSTEEGREVTGAVNMESVSSDAKSKIDDAFGDL